ncbi:hypothetical protein CcaverHIS631_0403680 [Cutaneotrichosporon cavernicola]|nr:hypothetical protein CcaverHIS631_0403680 [Cutaneotrichosporon cavernicola]
MQALANYADDSPSPPGPSGPGPSSRAQSPSEDEFEGMSEEDIFCLATRPTGDESEWGLPPEMDPNTADSRLQAKVSQFLRLKQQGQHINTSLMQSSSFANPTIYTKLVEFVDIDERASAFPGGGWITRRGLEGQVSAYGPKALQAQQSAMDAANKRAQEGKRREIAFTSTGRGGRRS